MKLVEKFCSGDRVPDWLLTANPTAPDAVLGAVVFRVDCEVFEHDDAYWIIGPAGEKVITISDCRDIGLSASSRDVVIPTGWITLNLTPGTGETISL